MDLCYILGRESFDVTYAMLILFAKNVCNVNHRNHVNINIEMILVSVIVKSYTVYITTWYFTTVMKTVTALHVILTLNSWKKINNRILYLKVEKEIRFLERSLSIFLHMSILCKYLSIDISLLVMKRKRTLSHQGCELFNVALINHLL